MKAVQASLVRRAASAGTLAATLLCWTPQAAAHGGIPRAFEVIFEAGNADNIVLRSDIWGFFRTADGGQTWQWACAELYGGRSLGAEHRNIALAPGGRILVASSFEGLRLTDDLCEWRRAESLGEELVEDVIVRGDAAFALTSTGADGGIRGQVWQSADRGETWAAFGALLPTDVAGTSLAIPDARPSVALVTGKVLASPTSVLMRSEDSGATWSRLPISDTFGSATLRIQGVHPTRPDVVFVWVDLKEELGQDAADQLWGTADGGATWSQTYLATGDLPGFAFSPDGTKIVIAGPNEGVRQATVDDALATGPAALKQVFEGSVWGLAWLADGLYAGNNNFTARGIPAFTLGISADEGATFEPLMNVCQVEFAACAAGSMMERVCRKPWADPGGFEIDYLQSSRCTGKGGTGGTGDAGIPGAADGGGAPVKRASGDSGSCSIGSTVPASDDGDGVGAALALLGLAVARRPRRRR